MKYAFLPVLFFLLVPSGARAEGVEITPFLGLRFGEGFIESDDTVVDLGLEEGSSFGVIVAFPRDEHGRIELTFSRQETQIEIDGFLTGSPLLDVTVDYIHIGGYYQWGDERTHPFALLSLGLTRIDPESGFDTENDFSVGFGGGVRVDLSKRVGLRFEGRGFMSLGGTREAVFNNGMVTVVYEGADFLWQFEASVGLVFAFG